MLLDVQEWFSSTYSLKEFEQIYTHQKWSVPILYKAYFETSLNILFLVFVACLCFLQHFIDHQWRYPWHWNNSLSHLSQFDTYSKTRLQRISRDTSKNFVIAVIRYIDIAKFVILYNEFELHKENKPGTMNGCWTLYIHIITWGSLSDNLNACGRELGTHSFDRYRNFDLWIRKWTSFF